MSSVSKTGRAWRQSNPILKKGEKGIESDTTLFKIGDGISPWTSLNYSQASMADVTELAAGLATKANSVDLASEITDREAADDSLTAMIATKVDNATLTATVNSAVVLRQLDPLRYDSTRLRAFRAALGARETTPVDILCVGDSVTEGQGSTTQSRRWIERMRDRVRAAFQPAGVVGGEGYIAGFFHSAGVTDRFTQTIATMTAREDLGGLGERTITLTGTNASATVTFTGTGIDILYAKGTTAGDFTWKIDAGGETTVSAFNAVISGGNVVQIRGLSATSHTLTIKRVTSSTYIEGVMVYNGDETSGIRLWEGSHSG